MSFQTHACHISIRTNDNETVERDCWNPIWILRIGWKFVSEMKEVHAVQFAEKIDDFWRDVVVEEKS